MFNNLYIIIYVSYFVDTFSGTTHYDTQRTLTHNVLRHTTHSDTQRTTTHNVLRHTTHSDTTRPDTHGSCYIADSAVSHGGDESITSILSTVLARSSFNIHYARNFNCVPLCDTY